uniref:Uncharacterized LOC100186344 n=1 Tax=Ciona intestinalis TaxID=7719 RepID=H2XWK7_CIOIN|nr:uncharacterized protein LOC100186344 [Ciona intestinalis]|eukprot:XP_002130465.1 uncharacterized protein LOC100186344 [Ciona intestinalis]
MSVHTSIPPKSPIPPPLDADDIPPSPPPSEHSNEDPHEELVKMRLGTSPHHTNPRSRTQYAWKSSMPIDEYRFVREQKRNQKNIPTTSSDYKEQHLIIAHRLAELEKRRVGTRYISKEQAKQQELNPKAAAPKKDPLASCVIS